MTVYYYQKDNSIWEYDETYLYNGRDYIFMPPGWVESFVELGFLVKLGEL